MGSFQEEKLLSRRSAILTWRQCAKTFKLKPKILTCWQNTSSQLERGTLKPWAPENEPPRIEKKLVKLVSAILTWRQCAQTLKLKPKILTCWQNTSSQLEPRTLKPWAPENEPPGIEKKIIKLVIRRTKVFPISVVIVYIIITRITFQGSFRVACVVDRINGPC